MFANALHVTFCLLLLRGVVCAPLIASSAIPHLPRDGLPPLQTKNVTLDGKEYTAVALDSMDQGASSLSFKIDGGFQAGDNHVPAILKQMWTHSEHEESLTRAEISFLKRPTIALHLFSQWSTKNTKGTSQIDVVVRDIGQDDPPFKPFYKWYLEDETMDAYEGLFAARKNIENRLIWYANEENLLYEDFTQRNIFFRKGATQERVKQDRSIERDVDVMPVDWGQPNKYLGVVDVSQEINKSGMIQEYKNALNTRLQDTFNVEELYGELVRHGSTLRALDFDWINYNDVRYRLVFIWTMDNNVNLYKVVNGFEGKPALLAIDRVGFESDKQIFRLKKDGLLLGTKVTGNEVAVFYKDSRVRKAQRPE